MCSLSLVYNTTLTFHPENSAWVFRFDGDVILLFKFRKTIPLQKLNSWLTQDLLIFLLCLFFKTWRPLFPYKWSPVSFLWPQVLAFDKTSWRRFSKWLVKVYFWFLKTLVFSIFFSCGFLPNSRVSLPCYKLLENFLARLNFKRNVPINLQTLINT